MSRTKRRTVRLRTKSRTKLGHKRRGGLGPQLLLTLALVAVFGGVLSNALKCGADTIKFQYQSLGKGATHVVTTDVNRTGAQKQFRSNEKLQFGMVLLMEKEGLYPPIIEACTNGANPSHTYSLTTTMMSVDKVYFIMTRRVILYNDHDVKMVSYDEYRNMEYDGTSHNSIILTTPNDSTAKHLLEDYLLRWIAFHTKYATNANTNNDVISWRSVEELLAPVSDDHFRKNAMQLLRDNNALLLDKYVITWMHGGNTMFNVEKNKLYCVDADFVYMNDNTDALDLITNRVFDGQIQLEMSPYVPTAAERIHDVVAGPFR
jgi:hypothetical protein